MKSDFGMPSTYAPARGQTEWQTQTPLTRLCFLFPAFCPSTAHLLLDENAVQVPAPAQLGWAELIERSLAYRRVDMQEPAEPLCTRPPTSSTPQPVMYVFLPDYVPLQFALAPPISKVLS